MGENPITQKVAIKALQKLNAKKVGEGAHHRYANFCNGHIVETAGLRHSSKRDILVPHIPKQLRVNSAFVLDLARCPKSRADWLTKIGVESLDETDDGPK